jgi:hypothetical protein
MNEYDFLYSYILMMLHINDFCFGINYALFFSSFLFCLWHHVLQDHKAHRSRILLWVYSQIIPGLVQAYSLLQKRPSFFNFRRGPYNVTY